MQAPNQGARAWAAAEPFFLDATPRCTASQLETPMRHAQHQAVLDARDRLRALLAGCERSSYADNSDLYVLDTRPMPAQGARVTAALDAALAKQLDSCVTHAERKRSPCRPKAWRKGHREDRYPKSSCTAGEPLTVVRKTRTTPAAIE